MEELEGDRTVRQGPARRWAHTSETAPREWTGKDSEASRSHSWAVVNRPCSPVGRSGEEGGMEGGSRVSQVYG